MNLANEIENWGDQDHPKVRSAVRVVLGTFLLIKGILFFENPGELQDLISSHAIIHLPVIFSLFIAYFIALVHLTGGAMIALGVYTRFWAFVQLPVLFGAVFFINVFSSHFSYELVLSVATLTLLTIFMVVGSGQISVDNYLGKAEFGN